MSILDKLLGKKQAQVTIKVRLSTDIKKPTAADYEGPPWSQAVENAKNHPTELLNQFDEKTKARIAHIISDGIKNKRGITGISRDIRKEYPDIKKSLVDTIALTETNNALSQAALSKMLDMGVDGKEWITWGFIYITSQIAQNIFLIIVIN